MSCTIITPARYIGTQPGFGNIPAIELYTLLAPVGEHPKGSTVSRQTLERHGFHELVVRVSPRPCIWTKDEAAA